MKRVYIEGIGFILVPFFKNEKLATFKEIPPEMRSDMNALVDEYRRAATHAEKAIVLSTYAENIQNSKDPAHQFMGSVLGMTVGLKNKLAQEKYNF